MKWHGGKFYLASSIAQMFPPHHTYVEPFGGGASVLLNKEPAKVEVYNDLDECLARFFRVLREEPEDLCRRLTLTPYSEAAFLSVAEGAADGEVLFDDIELARRDFVRWRLSIGGRGDSFSFTLHRPRRLMADVVSGYLSMIDEQLPLIVDRLRTVQVLCRPAADVIARWDSPETLFYCDPPYLPTTRAKGSRDVHAHEMTEQDHIELGKLLNRVHGKVVLSGYPSTLYDELYAGWYRVEFDIANHAAGGKSKARKCERLWLNYNPDQEGFPCVSQSSVS